MHKCCGAVSVALAAWGWLLTGRCEDPETNVRQGRLTVS